jgi:CubicO group peptidase (beta-lactamase class C family)
VRLIPAERLREVTAVSISGPDAVFGMPTTWGLGYSIGRIGAGARDTSTSFGLGGAGGSFAFGDTATGTAFALTKNRLSVDFETATRISQLVAGD